MKHMDQPNVTLLWDDTLRSVVITWRGFNEGQEFRAPMERALEVLRANRASRWLADLRDAKVNTAEDQQWLQSDLIPRAMQAGNRFTAFVVPKSTIAKLGVQRVLRQVGAIESETRFFDSMEAARKWLASTPT